MGATVYIVEDHAEMRSMLGDYLSLQSGIETVGAAASAEEALLGLDALRPDVVLVDLSLPGMTGLELVLEIRRRWPDVRCLVLSGHGQEHLVEGALDGGARGYVLKGDPRELPRAIEVVLEGGTFVSEKLR